MLKRSTIALNLVTVTAVTIAVIADYSLAAGRGKTAPPAPTAAAAAAGASEGGVAGVGIVPLTTQLVTSGLVFPLFVTAPPNDYRRIFIIEKQGRIRIYHFNPGFLQGPAFLDIDGLVGGGTTLNNEQGLLGMAFDPNYASNGFFYVYYTANGGGSQIVARYTVSANPNLADSTTASIILTMPDIASNHNAGWMSFGPDGHLYISTGDGGGACDLGAGLGNAQNIDDIRGKLLRIDVNPLPYTSPADNPFAGATAGLDEIWALGLRNPWRPTIDRLTGDIYIADVGQNRIEEIDFQPANTPGTLPGDPGYQGGRNYGWKCFEGNDSSSIIPSSCSTAGCPGFSSFIPPIHTYNHGVGVSITGGYVYRGCDIPSLTGTYFFADFSSARIFSFTYNGVSMTNFTERTGELAPGGGLFISNIASFGEDASGEMYILDHGGGEVFKIVPVTPAPTGDLNCDGVVNTLDLGIMLSDWTLLPATTCSGAPCVADINFDGVVNTVDLGGLLAGWSL